MALYNNPQPSSPNLPLYSDEGAQSQSRQGPHHRPPHVHKLSFIDDLLPTPIPSPNPTSSYFSPEDPSTHALRRSLSVAIITIFLTVIIFMASTDPGTAKRGVAEGLRNVFGVGSVVDIGEAVAGSLGLGSESEDTTTTTSGGETAQGSEDRPNIDFDQYKTLQAISADDYDLSEGHRLVFVGDVHTSFAPLQRLLHKVKFLKAKDTLIHLGDLTAKGALNSNEVVLAWMNARQVKGVRGNHDQKVIQWRAWMEWAGGADWQEWIATIDEKDEAEVLQTLKGGKEYPDDWTWKGDHWNIARTISSKSYNYLLSLPLILHFPALHAFVVHAGLLPSDPTKRGVDESQPLVQFSYIDEYAAERKEISATRNKEEVALLSIPQNTVPWNMMNMRSVFTSGANQGQVTKSSDKGIPWSEFWNDEMGRCTGPGSWKAGDNTETMMEAVQVDDDELANQEELNEREEKRQKPGTPAASIAKLKNKKLGCSPVTAIYGHAAGRGLDIKPWSKGLDTGCVYGRRLTALVLGDLTGLEGDSVKVGDQQGLLVSFECD